MLSDAEICQQLSKLKDIKPETIIVTDKVLGSGGQGIVSAGVWSGRSVALKKLKSANTLDRESIVEFLKELVLTVELASPHVVPYVFSLFLLLDYTIIFIYFGWFDLVDF